jgi:hypothetical protein
MASFVYQRAKELLATAALNLSTADLRVALVMTNTTTDTEKAANTFAGFTTLDECNGANYARVDLAGVTTVRDDGNLIVYLDANDAVFTNLGAGTRQNQAALLHVHNASAGSEIPVAFIDQGGFPFDGTGANNTIQWAALGILQLTG